MKRTFTLLLGRAVLEGCSQEEIGNYENQNDALVPIELGAGVNTLTRAAISSGDPVANAGIAGWETAADAANYSDATAWNTTISTTADNKTSQTVTWDDGTQRYYHAEADITTYMKAWYPGGTFSPTDKTVAFKNTKGDVDVLLAPVISGNKVNKGAKNLAFQHMTSQIKFLVKAGAGLAEHTTIKSITIKDAHLPTGFDLTKGIDDEGAVTYGNAADLIIPNIKNNQEITTVATSVGDPVMIKPIDSKPFTVTIETDHATYADKTVTVSTNKVLPGYAYDITLTFGQAGIELTATIADWEKATGGAEIQ